MYSNLLIIHSYLRWIVLGFLLFGLIFIFIKKSKKAIYKRPAFCYNNNRRQRRRGEL